MGWTEISAGGGGVLGFPGKQNHSPATTQWGGQGRPRQGGVAAVVDELHHARLPAEGAVHGPPGTQVLGLARVVAVVGRGQELVRGSAAGRGSRACMGGWLGNTLPIFLKILRSKIFFAAEGIFPWVVVQWLWGGVDPPLSGGEHPNRPSRTILLYFLFVKLEQWWSPGSREILCKYHYPPPLFELPLN